ncbi:MAG: exo-alpha-sialidase [Actinomycetaceae bacterium]
MRAADARPRRSVTRARAARRRVAAAASLLLGAGIAVAAPAVADVDPDGEAEFTEDVIFSRGDAGYFCFRIPAIVETTDGTLLAFAEGRNSDGCDDSGDIDTVVRRSTDGGETWGPIEVVFDAGVDTAGNPTPVVDRESGRIALITSHNPALNHNLRTPYLQYSEDDGLTWSEPEDIGDDVTDPSWEKWLATGPGAGIQLENGPHAGRMVVGMSHEGYVFGSDTHQAGASLAFSDDGGLTWQRGAEDQLDPAELKPQELSLAELPDGTILASARDQHGSDPGTRAFARSADGGVTFDGSFENDPELSTPVSQGSITSFVDAEGNDRVLYAGASHPRARVAVSVRSSFDGGATWQTWDEGRVVNWGNAGYSDILAVSDGTVALAYETGVEDAYREIRFARFNSAYLDAENEPAPGVVEHPVGPTTPDLSARENTAYVRGDSDVVEGAVDGALELGASQGDVPGSRVDVPFTEDVDLGDSDFTISTWFRYGSQDHDQSLVWAYHMGTGMPGIWVRAEPGADRIRAMLGTETGEQIVTADGAYDDEEWHHLSLVRRGDSMELWIDGEVVADGSAPLGSITRGGELIGIDGFFFGQRLDGVNQLVGGMDDVRIYETALGAEDLNALASGASETASEDNLLLHLPLEEIAGAEPEPEPGEPELPAPGRGFFLNDGWDATADHVFAYGRSGDEVLIGDWDGDGSDTLAVRRGNRYFLNNTLVGGDADVELGFGRAGDVVLVGDWDGDGVDSFAIRRGDAYFLTNTHEGGDAEVELNYGRDSDVVLVGDYDGDGADSFTVRRGNRYYINNSLTGGNADSELGYGRASDAVVVGDWDGDGSDSFAVRRGNLYLVSNSLTSTVAEIEQRYGRASDEVFVGDWDGDGTDTLGIRR